MSNTKNPKNTNNNILIIASVIFVTVAVIVFVISLSILNGGSGEDSGSLHLESSPSTPDGSSSMPESSSENDGSSSSSESSSSIPESTSSTPESSSISPTSSSTAPQSSSSAPSSSSSGEIDISQAQEIIENARLLIGTPFLDGGSDADGFDSSGFVYYVMRESGYISCPRDIKEQAKMGVARGFDEAKEGDILFFSNEIGGEPNFAGFYLGNGRMIGSLITSAFEGVVEVNIANDYYREHFVAGVGIS